MKQEIKMNKEEMKTEMKMNRAGQMKKHMEFKEQVKENRDMIKNDRDDLKNVFGKLDPAVQTQIKAA